jgi:Glucodextranase, domain B
MLRWFSLALLALLTVASVTTPAGTIGTTAMAPNSTSAGVAVTVTVTSLITDPSLIPASVNLQRLDSSGRVISVIGILHDDGLNGDAVAGDNVYTITTTIFENTPGTVNFRVSAGFKGSLLRSFSPLLPFQISGTPAGIAIVSPSNAAYLNLSPVTVNGTVGDRNAQVTINGVSAPVSGNTFVASVPLNEGPNTLTAVASNSNGTTSTASTVVTLDTTPPHVAIYSPASNSVTSDASTTVTGLVNDIVVGTVNSQQATVTVNGVAAQVLNRTFTALNIPLAIGPNTITAQAVDRAGNAASATITITRQSLTQPTLRIFSGNGQSGVIRTPLAAPLVAQLVNGAGQPLAGVQVVFQVTNQDGTLLPVGGTGAGSAGVLVNTNAQGLASANFTLGSRVGAGNNVITASTAGLATTAVFAASATPAASGLIVIDSGNNQSGVISQGLSLPFIAVVTDTGFNRLSGVPVTFTVKTGGGNFAGSTTLSGTSDSDGRVMATLTLGPNPGINNNLVEANFAGNTGFPATFNATGLAPGPANSTSISGVVLDNSDNAIPGVTMRLLQINQGNNGNVPQQVATAVQTDAQGHFTIKPAPVGVFKLMADGGTAQRPGSWPTLEYDVVPVSGQDNTVGLPIYLPELDTSSQLCVSPVQGGTLTLPRAPGFSLTIAPGSATFPGGSKTGCVSVTPVNMDKVPMSPGFGQQPRFVVTIQPVGTTFNPPAPITIPNVDGLAPRAVTEMYSYDHDLATFVAIGSATVSDDGSFIRSDPGVGVLKAGWNCGGNPNATGSAGTCPQCKKCDGSGCVADPSQNNNPCQVDQKNGFCLNGECHTCPTSTSQAGLTPIPLSVRFPDFLTGLGAVSAIQVSPGNIDWDGKTITESLTFDRGHSSCPINGFFDQLCGTGVTGGLSTFTVGNGGSELGFNFPAQHNVFYDEHLFGATVSVLDAPEIPPTLNSCTASCTQQYLCEGNVIGTYTVTRTFTRGTINGQKVTNITVTKQ